MASTPAHDEIARVAHAIWEAEGRPEGRDREHWRRAQQMIAEGRALPEPVVGQEAAAASAPADPAPATPGPRNPDPLPPTTAEGHVEVPSLEDVAGGALSDDPRAPAARPRRARR